MRGKDTIKQVQKCRPRITPAHAGKSIRPIRPNRKKQDHPRPCGEKLLGGRLVRRLSGSPPPMRGKADMKLEDSMTAGITPAHAGKRTCSRLCSYRREDHPRPCGEKNTKRARCHMLAGSPPPMRGKGSCPVQLRCVNGITPAHAGKRSSIHGRLCSHGDHPRPCGEKLSLLT